MKFLLVLCLIGFATASIYDDYLDNQVQEIIDAFKKGLDKGRPLRDVLGEEYGEIADVIERDVSDQLAEIIKKELEEKLQKIKDALDHGHVVAQKTVDRVKELMKELKELGVEFTGKLKELKDKIKNRIKDRINDLYGKLLDIFTGREERDIQDIVDAVLGRLGNLKEILKQIRETLKEKLDSGVLEDYLERTLSGSPLGEKLLEFLREKGVPAFQKLVDRLLGLLPGGDDRKRDLQGLVEHLKDLVPKIREWLKEKIQKGLEHAKNRIQLLKDIAKEVIGHAKEIHAETRRQLIELFEPYKEKLGETWKNLLDALRPGKKE